MLRKSTWLFGVSSLAVGLAAACGDATSDPSDGAAPEADAATPPAAPGADGGPADVVVVPEPPPYDGGGCGAGMKEIPAGTYMMGGTVNLDERPVHAVTLKAFCMDETEVTVDAYARCVAAGKCTPAGTEPQCNSGVAGRGAHPINCVTVDQARLYCAFMTLRLPTEEEWEYAARGTDGRVYPWGGFAPTSNACWSGTGNDLGVGNRRSTCPVGSYPSGNSPFGLADMAGNVMEWTQSGYSAAYDKPRDATFRVYRGGAWSHSDMGMLRTSSRVRGTLTERNNSIGLRCAR